MGRAFGRDEEWTVTGGDPKTDHSVLSCDAHSPRERRPATETASSASVTVPVGGETFVSVAWIDRVSHRSLCWLTGLAEALGGFSVQTCDAAHPDGFSLRTLDPVHLDGLSPSIKKTERIRDEHRDGFLQFLTSENDGLRSDGYMPDGRQDWMKGIGVEEHRAGSMSDVRRDGHRNANEPTALEDALLRRFGKKTPKVGSPEILSNFQTTPLLIPHAPSSTPTPPPGAHTQLEHPTRVPARSIDTVNETQPTVSSTPSATVTARVTPDETDQPGDAAVASELMDSGENFSHKRRRTAGKFSVRAKKEVMGEGANPKVDKTLMDSQDKPAVEDAVSTSSDDDKPSSVGEDVSGLQATDVPRSFTLEAVEVPDFVSLYATLVHDGAVPNGYLEPFLSLEHQLFAAAGRVDKRNAAITDISAARWRHRVKQREEDELRGERSAVDQLVSASG